MNDQITIANRMFTDEMLEKCGCTENQLKNAIRFGQKVETQNMDGKVVAYRYRGALYITDNTEVT